MNGRNKQMKYKEYEGLIIKKKNGEVEQSFGHGDYKEEKEKPYKKSMWHVEGPHGCKSTT